MGAAVCRHVCVRRDGSIALVVGALDRVVFPSPVSVI